MSEEIKLSFGLPYVGSIEDFDGDKEAFVEYAFSIAKDYINNGEQSFNLGVITFKYLYDSDGFMYWYDVYVGETRCGAVGFVKGALYKVGILTINAVKWFFAGSEPFNSINGNVMLDVKDPTKKPTPTPDPGPDPTPTPDPDPDPNLKYPIINDISDITAYQNTKLLLQFCAYDLDGYIQEFYFTLDEPHFVKFKPSYIGNSIYGNLFLFDSLGEYNCKIKVVDNDGLSTESNTFKITVVPPITSLPEKPTPPNVSNSEYIILYDKNSNEFESNGLGILSDCISCKVTIESNSLYELELEYPIGTKFDDFLLDDEYIIKCNVDNSSNSQLFRIYASEYIAEENIVKVNAKHITYDLENDFVDGVSLPIENCATCLQAIISSAVGNASNKFIASSNISKRKNFHLIRANVMEALLGVDNSILSVFGDNNTFIIRDNFSLRVESERYDKGFVIAYSKNITGFKRRKSIDNVITKIYPYTVTSWGKVITLKERYLKSPNASNYVLEKVRAVEFNNNEATDEESLRSLAYDYFNNTEIDMPQINYDINFVLLYNTNNKVYKELSKLEEVTIDDIVTVQDKRLGLNVKANVIKVVYDVLSKKYLNIELGNFKNEHREYVKNEQKKIKNIIRNTIT